MSDNAVPNNVQEPCNLPQPMIPSYFDSFDPQSLVKNDHVLRRNKNTALYSLGQRRKKYSLGVDLVNDPNIREEVLKRYREIQKRHERFKERYVHARLNNAEARNRNPLMAENPRYAHLCNSGMNKESKNVPFNSIIVCGLKHQITRNDIKQRMNELKLYPMDIRVVSNPEMGQMRGFAIIEFHKDKHAQRLLDINQGELTLRGRRYIIRQFTDSRISFTPTSTLFLQGLKKTSTEDSVLEILKDFDQDTIDSVLIGRDILINMPQGVCYLKLNTVETAIYVYTELRKKSARIDGRRIKINYYDEKCNAHIELDTSGYGIFYTNRYNSSKDFIIDPYATVPTSLERQIIYQNSNNRISSEIAERIKEINAAILEKDNTDNCQAESRDSKLAGGYYPGYMFGKGIHAIPNVNTYQYDEHNDAYFNPHTGFWHLAVILPEPQLRPVPVAYLTAKPPHPEEPQVQFICHGNAVTKEIQEHQEKLKRRPKFYEYN